MASKGSKPTKYFNRKNNREGRCAGYGICYTCTHTNNLDKCYCRDEPRNKPCLVKSTLKILINKGLIKEYYLYFCKNCSDRGLFALDNPLSCMECPEPIE